MKNVLVDHAVFVREGVGPMGKRATVAALLIGALLSSPVHADGLTLTMGKFSRDENGFVRQALSVKNGTTAPIEWLTLECGFLRGNELIATSVNNLQNLKVGETGYQTVTTRITDNVFPDHAECRARI